MNKTQGQQHWESINQDGNLMKHHIGLTHNCPADPSTTLDASLYFGGKHYNNMKTILSKKYNSMNRPEWVNIIKKEMNQHH